MIMGLDTDTPQTPDAILQFVEASNIPVLTINDIAHAVPLDRVTITRMEKVPQLTLPTAGLHMALRCNMAEGAAIQHPAPGCRCRRR